MDWNLFVLFAVLAALAVLVMLVAKLADMEKADNDCDREIAEALAKMDQSQGLSSTGDPW